MQETVTTRRVTTGRVASAIAEAAAVGEEMYRLAERLYPINRSITGAGVRKTLAILQERAPLQVHEVASGTPVFDWTVPPEWNLDAASIEDSSGRKIVDLAESTLHVLGYSQPVRRRMAGEELLEHLYWLPEHPEWIPARTSYYARAWGFCVTAAQRDAIAADTEYEVTIDSTLEPGALTYGEIVVKGAIDEEVLLSTYVCHPSLANDGISGIVVLEALARLLPADLRYTYRFLFAPSTIGALTWLARNEERLHRVRHGLVVSCVGDPGPITYKRSRRGDANVDRAAAHVVSRRPGGAIRQFTPWGGDERQFCSPGFDLPVGSLTRTPHGMYSEYHTSADDLGLIDADHLADSLAVLAMILDVLEEDAFVVSLSSKGEPQLGRRGLYETIGAGLPANVEESRQALLWVLNQADGRTCLLDVSERADLRFELVSAAAAVLEEAGLIETDREGAS
jgi:aminopeptidase-like protein